MALKRVSVNGKTEITLSDSTLGGILDVEINFQNEEIFIGMMPEYGFSLMMGFSTSYKAGFVLSWK